MLDAASVCLGTAAGTADEVEGALLRFVMSDDAMFDTGDVISADFSSLSISFAVSGSTVLPATGAAEGVAPLQVQQQLQWQVSW
jgi:phage gp29-like protein